MVKISHLSSYPFSQYANSTVFCNRGLGVLRFEDDPSAAEVVKVIIHKREEKVSEGGLKFKNSLSALPVSVLSALGLLNYHAAQRKAN